MAKERTVLSLRDRLRPAAPFCYTGLCACRVPAMTRRVRDAGVIFCYHNVVPTGSVPLGEPGLHVWADHFERQIRWLATHYAVVPLGEFVERLISGRPLRQVAAITFDDGYTGVFEHAVPLLRAGGLPATIFVVGNAVGRREAFWWDWPEVVAADAERRSRWVADLCGDGAAIGRELGCVEVVLPRAFLPADARVIREAAGGDIEIGAHSMTHRAMPSLDDEELEYEIEGSRTFVAALAGAPPDFFAYPYGSWDRRVRDCVLRAGYRGALTLDTGLNRPYADSVALRRINVPATISDAAFEAWSAGLCL